jgi:hypothetical protein
MAQCTAEAGRMAVPGKRPHGTVDGRTEFSTQFLTGNHKTCRDPAIRGHSSRPSSVRLIEENAGEPPAATGVHR